MPDRSFGHIARLERVVAAELCDRKREPVAPSWHGATVGWSTAVWVAAEAVGPPSRSPRRPCQPFVGIAATRNSSFAEGAARPSGNLSRIDRVC